VSHDPSWIVGCCSHEGGPDHLLLEPIRERPAAHRRGLAGALGRRRGEQRQRCEQSAAGTRRV